jgi:hypothetical protein
MISTEHADRFGREWIEAWNSRDLGRILAHYGADLVMASPYIAAIGVESSGVLKGKSAVADYWKKALARFPELHFELIAVFAGADSVAIHYTGVRGPVIEVLFFGPDGRIDRAVAHYPP